jgi:hypothetical protein
MIATVFQQAGGTLLNETGSIMVGINKKGQLVIALFY